MGNEPNIAEELRNKFSEDTVRQQATLDGIPTLWVPKDKICELLT